MQEFMVEFSYTGSEGRKYEKRKYEQKIFWSETAQEAVNEARSWNEWTNYCEGLRIERVYRSSNRRWEQTDAWK